MCDVPRKILVFMGIWNGKYYAMLVFGILTFPLIWNVSYIIMGGVKTINCLTIIAFVAMPSLVDSMWLILYSKRMKLKEIFKQTYHSSLSHSAPFVQLLSWFTLMLVHPTLFALYCFNDLKCQRFYALFYTKDDLGSLGLFALVLLSSHASQLVKSSFSCSVTAIYCSLCHRCRYRILEVKHELEVKNFPLLDVLQRYQETLKTVSLLQEVFSPVMLMLVIVNFSSLFTGLFILLLKRSNFEALDIVVVLMLNLLCLLAYTAFGAEIPIRMGEVNLKLHEINEEMAIRPNWTNEKSSVEAMLLRPEIVLSACNVLYFNRGFILAAIGSLFTYGVLVLQLYV